MRQKREGKWMEVWGASRGEKVPRRVKGLCNDWEGLPENSVDWERERVTERGKENKSKRESTVWRAKKNEKVTEAAVCARVCVWVWGLIQK